MTKKNAARNALFTSVVALLLCVSMLVGTTFAWFTDSVTSGGNIIKSGTLDVEMYWADGTKAVPADGSDEWKDASKGAIFNYDLWEPGYTEVRHIKIENNGTLALQYQLQIVPNGEVSNLADVIDVYYTDPAIQVADRSALAGQTPMGTLTQALSGMATSANGNLKAGEDVTVTLALKMQESAGNEYQDLAIGSDFAIILLATQYTYEDDDFGIDYDENAQYPAYAEGTGTLNTTTNEIEVEAVYPGTTDVAATVTIPADALAEGKEDSRVIVTPTATDGTVTVQTNEIAKTYDVSVTNIKEGNTTDIEVVMNVGTGLKGVKLFHKDVEVTNAVYDSAAGTITFTTTSFSPYTVVYEDDTIQTTNAPGAKVTSIPDDQLNVSVPLYSYGNFSNTGRTQQGLDVGFTFEATQTAEEAAASEYANWHADYVVSFDKPIASGTAGLAGQYNFWSMDWVGFEAFDTHNDNYDGIPANTPCRLLEGKGVYVNYTELCRDIKVFNCGVFNNDDANNGTVITVELRLYETKDPADTANNTTNEETGNYITIGTYTYTFE